MSSAAIQIRVLEPGDSFLAAQKICLENYTSIVRIHVLQSVKSPQFIIFAVLTYLALCLFLRPDPRIATQLILLLTACVLQALYAFLFFGLHFLPPESTRFEAHWREPHRRLLVAECVEKKAKVVATLAIEQLSHKDTPHVVELFRIRVLPSFRRNGLAQRLSQKAEDLARKLYGATTMRVSTSVHRPEAIRLYESLGYRVIRKYTEKGCYPGVPAHRVLFEKSLD